MLSVYYIQYPKAPVGRPEITRYQGASGVRYNEMIQQLLVDLILDCPMP